MHTGQDDAKLQNYGLQQRIRSKEKEKEKPSDSDAYGRTVSTGEKGSSDNSRPVSGDPKYAPSWVETHDNLQGTNPKRAGSSGPAPAAGSSGGNFQSAVTGFGLHSSGGSLGAHSYRTISMPNMARSRTQGRIMTSQVKRHKLEQLVCPCYEGTYKTRSGVIRGEK